jgi:hypothetical protein
MVLRRKRAYCAVLVLFSAAGCPQEYWNNAYSLAAMLLIFAVYYVSLMKHKSSQDRAEEHRAYMPRPLRPLCCCSFVISTDRAASVRFFSFHLTCMLAVLLIVNSVGSGKELMRIVDFSMAGLLVSAVYAIGQRISELK